MSLRCPRCGSDDLRVETTRKNRLVAGRWRLRVCKSCDHYFDTVEKAIAPIPRRYGEMGNEQP